MINLVKVFKIDQSAATEEVNIVFDPFRRKYPGSLCNISSCIDQVFETSEEANTFSMQFVPLKKRES